MMFTLTKTAKREITEDWHALFPSFEVFRPMRLLRRCGPVLHGICLERDSGNASYLPTAHIHCLCEPFPVILLLLSQRLLTHSSRADDRIRVEFHASRLGDAAERLRHQSLLPLDGPLSLKGIVAACERYRTMGKADLAFPIRYFETIVLLHVWAGDYAQATDRLSAYTAEMATWHPEIMEREGGLRRWQEKLRLRIEAKQAIHDVVAAQLAEHGLGALKDHGLAIA